MADEKTFFDNDLYKLLFKDSLNETNFPKYKQEVDKLIRQIPADIETINDIRTLKTIGVQAYALIEKLKDWYLNGKMGYYLAAGNKRQSVGQASFEQFFNAIHFSIVRGRDGRKVLRGRVLASKLSGEDGVIKAGFRNVYNQIMNKNFFKENIHTVQDPALRQVYEYFQQDYGVVSRGSRFEIFEHMQQKKLRFTARNASKILELCKTSNIPFYKTLTDFATKDMFIELKYGQFAVAKLITIFDALGMVHNILQQMESLSAEPQILKDFFDSSISHVQTMKLINGEEERVVENVVATLLD